MLRQWSSVFAVIVGVIFLCNDSLAFGNSPSTFLKQKFSHRKILTLDKSSNVSDSKSETTKQSGPVSGEADVTVEKNLAKAVLYGAIPATGFGGLGVFLYYNYGFAERPLKWLAPLVLMAGLVADVALGTAWIVEKVKNKNNRSGTVFPPGNFTTPLAGNFTTPLAGNFTTPLAGNFTTPLAGNFTTPSNSTHLETVDDTPQIYDINSNGLRDDIDDYVNSLSFTANNSLEITLRYAKSLQKQFDIQPDASSAKKIFAESADDLACLVINVGYERARDIARAVELEFLGSKTVFQTYVKNIKLIDGEIFELNLSDEKTASCNATSVETATTPAPARRRVLSDNFVLPPNISEPISCVSQSGTKVIYINGVLNTYNEALLSLGAIKALHLDGAIDQTGDVVYELYWNSSHGAIGDFMEAIIGKLDPRGELTPAEITKMFNDHASEIAQYMTQDYLQSLISVGTTDLANFKKSLKLELLNKNKVLIVSHSQGNLFANTLLTGIFAEVPEAQESIGNIQVATPASNIVAPHSAYTTYERDLIINLVRRIIPSIGTKDWNIGFKQEDLSSFPLAKGTDQLIHHGFESTYLTIPQTRSKIIADILQVSSELRFIEEDNVAQVCPALNPQRPCGGEPGIFTDEGGFVGSRATLDNAFAGAGVEVCGKATVSNSYLEGNIQVCGKSILSCVLIRNLDSGSVSIAGNSALSRTFISDIGAIDITGNATLAGYGEKTIGRKTIEEAVAGQRTLGYISLFGNVSIHGPVTSLSLDASGRSHLVIRAAQDPILLGATAQEKLEILDWVRIVGVGRIVGDIKLNKSSSIYGSVDIASGVEITDQAQVISSPKFYFHSASAPLNANLTSAMSRFFLTPTIRLNGNMKIKNQATLFGNIALNSFSAITPTDSITIGDHAQVYGTESQLLRIHNRVNIGGSSLVNGYGSIVDAVNITDSAKVLGRINLRDNTRIYENAVVDIRTSNKEEAVGSSAPMIHGESKIFGNSQISGYVSLRDVMISGNAQVVGASDFSLCGSQYHRCPYLVGTVVYDEALITGGHIAKAQIYGGAQVKGGDIGRARIYGVDTLVDYGSIGQATVSETDPWVEIFDGAKILGAENNYPIITHGAKIFGSGTTIHSGVIRDQAVVKEGAVIRASVISDYGIVDGGRVTRAFVCGESNTSGETVTEMTSGPCQGDTPAEILDTEGQIKTIVSIGETDLSSCRREVCRYNGCHGEELGFESQVCVPLCQSEFTVRSAKFCLSRSIFPAANKMSWPDVGFPYGSFEDPQFGRPCWDFLGFEPTCNIRNP